MILAAQYKLLIKKVVNFLYHIFIFFSLKSRKLYVRFDLPCLHQKLNSQLLRQKVYCDIGLFIYFEPYVSNFNENVVIHTEPSDFNFNENCIYSF